MGAMAMLMPRWALARAASSSLIASRTIERVSTMPPLAPMPWAMRAAISHSMVGAHQAARLPRKKTTSVTSPTCRRPARSLQGPTTSMKAAIAAR